MSKITVLALLCCATASWAAELRWQQQDGARPIDSWGFRRFGTLTPFATVKRTQAPEQTVTPGNWFPTPGPGTPQPTTRQYKADLPVVPGQLIYGYAVDDLGQRGPDSNLYLVPTPTPTDTATVTPQPTNTPVPTNTVPVLPPAPHLMLD